LRKDVRKTLLVAVGDARVKVMAVGQGGPAEISSGPNRSPGETGESHEGEGA
jgi:hypothetical protein